MMREQTENVELDIEINSKSTQNDFYFSYLTIETDDEDGFRQPDVPEDLMVENIEFKEDVSVELYETVPLPTLQHLAASVIAIALWRRGISCENANRIEYFYPVSDFLYKEYKDVEELLQHLPLPDLIRELVRNCLKPVREELCEWAEIYEGFISTPLRISDLMQCAWLSEGIIDHQKTALNMLSIPEMNILDRFRIMSEFCLEDELKKLSPNAIPEHFTRRIKFYENPLQYYWICYVNNNFDKFRMRNGQSIEAFVISSANLYTRSAIQYFWNRLNTNEQISAAVKQLKEFGIFQNIQRLLFSNMNQFQKFYVLSTIPFHVIENFYYERLYQLAFLTAVRFGNMLTFESFSHLISNLLTCSLYSDYTREAMFYLVKIWNYLSNDYKNQSWQVLTDEIIDVHCTPLYNDDDTQNWINTDFLVAFLSSHSVDLRRQIIFNGGADLVLCCDSSEFNQVIRTCIPDTEDQMLFEKYLLGSGIIKSHCLSMLDGSKGNLKQLSDFLQHFISNSADIVEFFGRILMLQENEFPIPYDPIKRWNNVIEFIDGYLKNTPISQIKEYKNAMAWIFIHIYAQCKHDYKNLPQFIKIITSVIEEDLLEYYKKLVFDEFYSLCCWVKFDKVKVHHFLLWCLNYDYMDMKRFVKSLSIDGIFWHVWEDLTRDRALKEVRSRQDISEKLAPIDEMLLWYFGNSDRVKEFKLGKVFFGFTDTSPGMFVENDVDEVFVRNVLPWFFDGDREEICKFKKRYKNDGISKLIHID